MIVAMSEVRALLLTDVVDSTKLSQALGDEAMADVWVAHDRVARDLLPAWNGREIDKTDGMLLLFRSADDAAHYALAYHAALGKLPVPLRARAGLHVGPVVLRENLPEDVARGAKLIEVDGLAKPTVARVMALAHGGQTLVTEQARRALGDGGWTIASHGHWMLKGVDDPVELFEVGGSEATFLPPVDGEKAYRVARGGEFWLPAREIANNLPQQLTSFIGRERERCEVRAALDVSRLVTLLGMGGMGKTRLSLQVAAETMASFSDGVWFLDLAPLHDPALVAAEAAQVVGVREQPGEPLVRTLGSALRTRRTLLIFDNCEHLIEACASLADAILRVAPQVRILASSREALQVPGEHIYPVLPLPVPAHGEAVGALARSTAVRLFVERAQTHRSGFALTEHEAPAVAELVVRLEGIPLALELAAARMRTMSVAEINARLNDRYKLLTGGGRVLLARQQTLRALVDWSYDLLGETERLLLARLSVFAGGFDIEAAEQVCGINPIDPFEILDVVGSLVERSLVMADIGQGSTRYRMLETIRDYAREKLEASGERADVAARHCEHYFALAKRIRDGFVGPDQAKWIELAESDLDNLRAATALALGGGVDPFIAVKIAVALQGFWILRGYAAEGRGVIRAALALDAVRASDMAQAFALYVGAALAYSQSDHAEARAMLQTCLVLRRKLGNAVDIAATLSTLAMANLQGGDWQAAREAALESIDLFRAAGNRVGEAIVLLQLGQIAQFAGEEAEARQRLQDSLALARDVEHRETEGESELTLGKIEFEAGDQDAARRHLERSATICAGAADKRGEASAAWWLAKVDLEERLFADASRRLSDALRTFRAFDMRAELLACLDDCAALAHMPRARTRDAAIIAAAAAASRKRLSLVQSQRAAARSRELASAIAAVFGTDHLARVAVEAAQIEIDHVIDVALGAIGPDNPTPPI
jgi:predicted ATPase/class 3 adenylate cyclase